MVKMADFKEKSHNTLSYSLNMVNAPMGRRSRRIGMATMGNPCLRAMWFKFRWARISPFPIRVQRIFDLGHACEDLVIDSLKAAGVEITREQEEVPGWGGHIWGFIDGVAMGVPEAPKTPHLWENKSSNDRIFKTIVKKGVKAAKLDHYVQMQMYMGKKDLTRALYTVINKNDSEIYVERIHFYESDYKEYMSRGMDVISHEVAPPNLFQDPNKQACKWCDFKPICYEGEEILKSCRSCVRVDIEEDGKWSCNLLSKELSIEEQEAGCDRYRPVRIT
jgi:hypothetical protein